MIPLRHHADVETIITIFYFLTTLLMCVLSGKIESIVSSNSLITLRGTSGAFIEQYNVREEIDQGDKELEINRVLRINESRTDQPCLIEIFDHLK